MEIAKIARENFSIGAFYNITKIRTIRSKLYDEIIFEPQLKPVKIQVLGVTQPPGVAQPLYSRGHNKTQTYNICPSLIEIGSKTAEENSAQTNRQTDRHYENNGHLAVNQKCVLRPISACSIRCRPTHARYKYAHSKTRLEACNVYSRHLYKSFPTKNITKKI